VVVLEAAVAVGVVLVVVQVVVQVVAVVGSSSSKTNRSRFFLERGCGAGGPLAL
jgi:hypothetical protein